MSSLKITESSALSIQQLMQLGVQLEYQELPKGRGWRCILTPPPSWQTNKIVSEIQRTKKKAKADLALRTRDIVSELDCFLRPSNSVTRRRGRGMAPLAPTRLEEGIQVQAQQLQSYRGLEIGFDPEKDTWSVHATFVDLNKLPETALNGLCRRMIVLTLDPVPETSGIKMHFPS
ncbi:hypothetical protein A4X09_0g7781, partial [Tilletia walkeri]